MEIRTSQNFGSSAQGGGLPIYTAPSLFSEPSQVQSNWRAAAQNFVSQAAMSLIVCAAAAHLLSIRDAHAGVIAFGVIAIWRYVWWLIHYLRAAFYLKVRFPKMRATVAHRAAGRAVSRIYAVVMSYDIPANQFVAVYRALFANVLTCGAPMTVIASVTSLRDKELLFEIYEDMGCPSDLDIVVQYQKGDGKRSAMAMALRAIARRCPPRNSLTLFLDGDILIEPNTLSRCLPFFLADPELAALTIDNGAIVDGGQTVSDWYALRHAQRHLTMASMAMSERLLVLTGRFSIYRTQDAVSPAFIRIIESDWIDHWRFARINFLSGDDKSMWYHMLRLRRKMIYLPDVVARGFEALPAGNGFLSGTTKLMFRWFGNMIRNSGRSIRLGPKICGTFVWCCLLDQRISIWTTLIGPIVAIMMAVMVTPVYLVHYFAWIVVSRSMMSLMTGLLWRQFRVSWPFLMLYTQVWGSLLKTYIVFRPNQQSWTRQSISTDAGASAGDRATSLLLHSATLLMFATIIGLFSGTFSRLSW